MGLTTNLFRVWLLTSYVIYAQLFFDDEYIDDGGDFLGMAGFVGVNGATETLSLTPTMTITQSTISETPSVSSPTISPTMSSTVAPSPTRTIVVASMPITYGTAAASDTCFGGRDDSCFPRQTLSMKIPIGEQLSDKLYVCPNGLVCIDNPVTTFDPPSVTDTSDDRFNNMNCVAPYFTDLTTKDSGEVCLHVYDLTDDYDIDDSVFDNFRPYLNSISQNIGDPVMVITATWDSVPEYVSSETVTFQNIYVTDGETAHSFVFYKQGGMLLTSGNVFIGNLINGNVNGISLSSTALLRPDINVNINGKVGGIYLTTPSAFSNTINYGARCLAWVKTERSNKAAYAAQMNSMPRCQCNSFGAFLSSQWHPFSTNTDGVTFYVLGYGSNTKVCAYRSNGAFIRSGRYTATFKKHNPITSPQLYLLQDELYRYYCCERSNKCNKYFNARPRETRCMATFLVIILGLFGDPHLLSLDGLEYTFNGHGEYTLLQTVDNDFTIQCRTDRLKKQDDSLIDATVFSGFAFKGSNLFAQVTLDFNKTGMEILAGGGNVTDDYTFDFYNTDFNKVLPNEMSLRKIEGTLAISFPNGILFNVTQENGLLSMSMGVSKAFEGKTAGLLGNFNGDTSDDLIPKGSQSSISTTASTERQIFEFGQTWVTTSATSIFQYNDGDSWETHNFPDFVPKFLEDGDPVLRAQAETTCNGDRQCIFDLVFTGNQDIALQTKVDNEKVEELDKIVENQAPSIEIESGSQVVDGDNYLYVVKNQPVTFAVNVSDDGNFTYGVDSSATDVVVVTTDPADVSSADVAVTLTDPNPKDIRVSVTDNNGLIASTALTTVYCSGCNDKGTCNFNDTREDSRATDFFKYATCECNEFREGIDCENIVNLCEPNPCSLSRACTNVPAADANSNPSFTCAACPTGYIQDPNDANECIDIDECDSNNDVSGCAQTCVNTRGSYYCACNQGYRLLADALTCTDIDECEEGTSGCKQVCTNTEGGATCSCFDGFTYNTNTDTCDASTPTCTLDCSSADGCIDNGGTFECVCKLGYSLNSGNTCVDIDECKQPICSQDCTNTVGSFTCSCQTGYQLLADKVTCQACEVPTYGDNCESRCLISSGVASCNHVIGPVCRPGYQLPDCTDIDECTVQPDICNDASKVCTNTVGSYTCTCLDGFTTGDSGECTDIDECSDATTLNDCSQQCTNNNGGYSCSCNEGFVTDPADQKNCLDIDECTTGSSECEHLCENTPGRYRCQCYFGYILQEDRRSCLKIQDPCESQTTVTCSHICRVIDGSPQCSCPQGLQLGTDAQTCQDINECASTDTNKCSQTDSCVNFDGGYNCSCQAGFKLDNDGRTCTACDEYHYGPNCENSCDCQPGAIRCDSVTGCVCSAGWSGEKCDLDRNECSAAVSPCTGDNFECVNTLGSYTCECIEGFTKNAGACEDIDECSSTVLNDCSQTCSNTVGSYSCSCTDGFIANGKNCEDIDECAGQNDCSQVCTNTPGRYRCTCNNGYRLNLSDRTTCIPINECESNQCTNAACVRIDNVDTCNCNKGYEFDTGSTTNCVDIKECDQTPNPCSQLCNEEAGGYTCSCNQLGFQLDADQATCIPCSDNKYGANCAETCICKAENTESCNTATGVCSCKLGWTGNDCSQDVNECDTANICPDLSVCQNSNGSYTCVCNDGYFMSANNTCYDEDECSTGSNQCEQICTNTPGSYNCSCRLGFQLIGNNCTACQSNKFGDNCAGVCNCNATNSKDASQTCNIETGTCICKDGWSGTTCDEDVDECLANTHGCSPTANEGCHNTIGGFVCSCFTGYVRDFSNTCELDTANVTTPIPPPGQQAVNFFVSFDLNLPDHVDLNVTLTNALYRGYVETGMSQYLRNKMGTFFKTLRVLTVSKGSLNSGMNVDIDDSTASKQQFSNAIDDLVTNNETVDINNVPSKVELLTVANTTIDVNAMNADQVQCHVYKLVNEQCQLANYQCSVENGSPVCRRPEGETDIGLLVGLGVGIPLLMILATIIAFAVYRIVRNNRRGKQYSYDDSDDRSSSAFSNAIPKRINTQGTDIPYLGFPKLYDDDLSSFASDTPSRRELHRHMRHGRQYDNEENFGQEENTWGFLYRYITPTSEFRIQRPKVDF